MQNWEEFVALDAQVRREKMCVDILAQIKIGKVKSTSGFVSADDLQDNPEDRKCYCCAVGAAILAKNNYCTVDDCVDEYRYYDNRESCFDAMEEAGFIREEANYIEDVFEGLCYYKGIYIPNLIEDRTERLEWIYTEILYSEDYILSGYENRFVKGE